MAISYLFILICFIYVRFLCEIPFDKKDCRKRCLETPGMEENFYKQHT